MFTLIFGLGGQEVLFLLLLIPVFVYMVKIFFSKNYSIGRKILWLITLLIFQIIGLIVFFILGENKKL